MAIYKVHIKTEGNDTTYTTNATTFATITRHVDSGKFEVTTPNSMQLADTMEEADKIAREFTAKVMASVGVVPNFTKE
ncbi:MAG: hypothetical protein K2J17_08255 [Paramuribaculum sp.]|nr:hypothetical protein [Paramuribaculum sp.]MDE6783697.1 hypothetical protein [Paramuribaculum sp.]